MARPSRETASRQRTQVGPSPGGDIATAAAADRDHIAERIRVAMSEPALELGSLSPPLQKCLSLRAVDEPLAAQPAARELPFPQVAANLLRGATEEFRRVSNSDQAVHLLRHGNSLRSRRSQARRGSDLVFTI